MRTRTIFLGLLLGSLALTAGSLYVIRDYLLEEVARFSPVDLLLALLFDIFGLLCFVAFCLRVAITGTFPSGHWKHRTVRGVVGLAVLSFVIDTAWGAHALYGEWKDHENAAVAVGNVVRINRSSNEHVCAYTASYEFRTANGRLYTGRVRINDILVSHNIPPGPLQHSLSRSFIDRVKAGTVPFPVTVHYASHWPDRSWADTLDWEDNQDHLAALLPLLGVIQLIFCLPGFLLCHTAARMGRDREFAIAVAYIMPFLAQVAYLVLFATLTFATKAAGVFVDT